MFTQLENGAGLDVILWLQSMRAAPLDWLALVFDVLGSDLSFVVIVLLFYWCVNRHLGRRSILVLILAELVVTIVKLVLQTPRPYAVSDAVFLIGDGGTYGIPSGHMAISLALLGYAVVWLKLHRGWWWLALYMTVMAWARMYAGAHYPQDVIAGIVVGLALVWFTQRFMDSIARFWGSLRIELKLVLVILATALVSLSFEGEDQQMILGIMAGGGIALLLEERYLRFDASSGSRLVRLLRFIGGIVLVAIGYYGLKMILDPFEPEALFRILRYAFLGALVIGIYPWLCVRAGFMDTETSKTAPASAA